MGIRHLNPAARRALSGMLLAFAVPAAAGGFDQRIAEAAGAVAGDVVAWRRDIHQHPELSNREARAAARVAAHLRALQFDAVHTGIAHTGVVALLKGGKPGPTVALRADMDALPVAEPAGLPFASTVRAEYNGRQVGVMHACGHDAHTAMLMGAASVLAALRNAVRGAAVEALPVMAAEDFSFYQREIPGLFVFLGVNRDGVAPEQAAPNHSPLFFVNEDALETGVRALATLAVDYLCAR